MRHGFHATSMRQILDAAGMSSGGAYNYFPSKDDIVLALVAEERADIDYLVARLRGQRDPVVGIAEFVYDAIAHIDREQAVLTAEIYAEAPRNPVVREMTDANSRGMEQALRSAISEGVKANAIASRHDPTETAELLLALIEGYIGRIAANPKLAAGSAARVARATVRELLGGSEAG